MANSLATEKQFFEWKLNQLAKKMPIRIDDFPQVTKFGTKFFSEKNDIYCIFFTLLNFLIVILF